MERREADPEENAASLPSAQQDTLPPFPPSHSKEGGGTVWIVVACVVFSLSTMAVHAAGARGIPSAEILLIRCISQVIFSGGACLYVTKNPLGPPAHRKLPILRGVFGSLSAGCMYYGATHIAVSDATAILFSSPIWTPFIAYLFVGERLQRVHMVAVLVGFVGVLLVVQPEVLTHALHQLWTWPTPEGALKALGHASAPKALPGTSAYTLAAMVCLLGSCCSAAAYVIIRKTEEVGLYFQVLVFYFGLMGIGTSLLQLVFLQQAVWPTEPGTWVYLASVCALGYAGQIALNKGAQLIPASQTALLRNLDVALVVLWQVLFLKQLPTLWSVVGIACICGCTVLMVLCRDRRPAPQ